MRKMRYAFCHTQRRLPIALQLKRLKCRIPVCDAVFLAHNVCNAVLRGNTCRLNCRRELARVCEQIKTGNIHTAVGTHSVTDSCSLRGQRFLSENMSGHNNAVFPAPIANSIHKHACKAFGCHIAVNKAAPRRAIGVIPNKLRHNIKRVKTVLFPEPLRKILIVRRKTILTAFCEFHKRLLTHTRLIGKNCLGVFSEILTERSFVLLVRNPNKLLHSFRVHSVNICLSLKPHFLLVQLQIRKVNIIRTAYFLL